MIANKQPILPTMVILPTTTQSNSLVTFAVPDERPQHKRTTSATLSCATADETVVTDCSDSASVLEHHEMTEEREVKEVKKAEEDHPNEHAKEGACLRRHIPCDEGDSSPPTEDAKRATPSNDGPCSPAKHSESTNSSTTQATTGGKSILKRCGMRIPISNKGWKSLPKPDLAKSAQTSAAAATTASEDRRKSARSRRRVRFTAVWIRAYDQCVGDNPAVSYGTPIQLDWGYEQRAPIDLDAFEASRSGLRRGPRRLGLNYYQRRNILMHRFGYAEAELAAAERAAARIQRQRGITKALLPAAALEHLVASAARKARRALVRGNGSKSCNRQRPARRRSE